MLRERLMAEAHAGDGLDEVRLGAVEQASWQVDLLDRERRNFSAGLACRDRAHYDEITAAGGLIDAEIHERLESCRDDEERRAVRRRPPSRRY